MLRIDGLTTTYGSIIAMRDVSLHVDGGEVVGLIGPNGAGKSTLLNTTVGLVGPASGRVTLEGRTSRGSTPDAMLRLGVALVPSGAGCSPTSRWRRTFSWPASPHPPPTGVRGSTRSWRCSPCSNRRRSFPAGYLSGGEAQQLAVGRALMSGARLLLMDEPTSASRPRWWTWCSISSSTSRSQGRTLLVVEQNAGRLSGSPIGRT